MTEQQLLDLIERMNHQGDTNTSDDSISWHAFRYAETLQDRTIIPLAIDLVERLESHEQRDSLYFILYHIGRHLGDRDVFLFLVDRLGLESNKYVLSSLLGHLATLDDGYQGIVSVKQLVPYATHSAWQVKYDAIQVFHLCDPIEAECFLRTQLAVQAHDAMALQYLVGELSYVGNKETIPSLIKLAEHQNGGVASSAIRTLTQLGDESLLPLFIECMSRRSIEVKYSALCAIDVHGDEHAVPIIIQRVRQLISRKRIVEDDALIVAMTFLSRYPDHVDVIRIIDWMIKKKWDFLFSHEQEWLRRQNILS